MPKKRKAKIIKSGKGRQYQMGRISSTFIADTKESNDSYSVSEWWIKPMTEGPGEHKHPEDHVFLVLQGIMSISINGKWTDCEKGTYVIILGGVLHDFQNRSSRKAGILAFNDKTGFESHMPQIEDWFKENPPQKII